MPVPECLARLAGMTSRSDPRQAALAERLRLLKRVVVAASAGLAVTFWWLVAPAASSANASVPASAGDSTSAATGESDGAFFGSSSRSTSSLGNGTLRVPLLRSHGS